MKYCEPLHLFVPVFQMRLSSKQKTWFANKIVPKSSPFPLDWHFRLHQVQSFVFSTWLQVQSTATAPPETTWSVTFVGHESCRTTCLSSVQQLIYAGSDFHCASCATLLVRFQISATQWNLQFMFSKNRGHEDNPMAKGKCLAAQKVPCLGTAKRQRANNSVNIDAIRITSSHNGIAKQQRLHKDKHKQYYKSQIWTYMGLILVVYLFSNLHGPERTTRIQILDSLQSLLAVTALVSGLKFTGTLSTFQSLGKSWIPVLCRA